MKPLLPKLPQFCLGIIVIAISFAFVTVPSWQALWTLWTSDSSSYSHGPLIILVSIWLLYTAWGDLQRGKQGRFQLPAALFFGVGASIVWTLGYLTGIALFQWVSIPVMVTGLVVACADKRIRPAALVPGLALYFAVPLWELLVPTLQSAAVAAVSVVLQLTNVPVYIKGIEVSIPGGRFLVEGGCSGVRYLLVSVAITCLWSFLHLRKRQHQVILIAASFILSILSNWLRILIIVLIGYVTKMESSIVYDHEYFGWIIFAITLIPIFGLAFWLERREGKAETSEQTEPSWSVKGLLVYFMAIAALPVISQLMILTIQTVEKPRLASTLTTSLFESPQQEEAQPKNLYTGTQRAVFGGWKPSFPGMDSWGSQEFHPTKLQVLIGHIKKQSQTQEIFSADNSFNALNPSKQWRQTVNGDALTLQNIYGQRWTARVMYRVGGKFTQKGLTGKLSQLERLSKNRLDAQLFVIGLPCKTTCETEEQVLKSLTHQEVDSWLEQ